MRSILRRPRRRPLTLEAARSLTMRADPWLSCEDCFDEIDRLVDDVVSGDAPLGDPERVHLAGCHPCHEEARTLTTLAALEAGVDCERALARLEAELDESRSPLHEVRVRGVKGV